LPAAPPKGTGGAAQPQGGQAQPIDQVRPNGRYKPLQTKVFTINYPDNWETFGGTDSPVMTIAPRGALIAGANGQTSIGYGMIVGFYTPQANSLDLNRDTQALVQEFSQSGVHRTNEQVRNATIQGSKALLTPLESQSPYPREVETDMLVTVARPQGLFYVLFIAPRSDWGNASPSFNQILGSIQFPR
jgi:hypothetical protein